MADEVDQTQERLMYEQQLRESKRFELEPGEPGDCELCGEWFSRLVGGACGRCRDRYHLP